MKTPTTSIGSGKPWTLAPTQAAIAPAIPASNGARRMRKVRSRAILVRIGRPVYSYRRSSRANWRAGGVWSARAEASRQERLVETEDAIGLKPRLEAHAAKSTSVDWVRPELRDLAFRLCLWGDPAPAETSRPILQPGLQTNGIPHGPLAPPTGRCLPRSLSPLHDLLIYSPPVDRGEASQRICDGWTKSH